MYYLANVLLRDNLIIKYYVLILLMNTYQLTNNDVCIIFCVSHGLYIIIAKNNHKNIIKIQTLKCKSEVKKRKCTLSIPEGR